MRVNRIIDKDYGQTRRFPEEIKRSLRFKSSLLKEHIFCYACGREITSMNFSDGELYAKKAYWKAETNDGFEVYFCGWTRSCYAIQAEKNGGEKDA